MTSLVALAASLLLLAPGTLVSGAPITDQAAWRATDVLEVSEGNALDGEVTVLAAWTGSLPAGEVLRFPELAAFAPPEARVTWEDGAPAQVIEGRRLLLFLCRSGGGDAPTLMAASADGALTGSLVWLEAGRAWVAGRPAGSPRPYLVDLGSADALRRRVAELNGRRAELARVRTIADLGARARELASFALDPVSADDALEALVACQARGVPVLEALLAPEVPVAPGAARALGRVGTPAAQAALVRALGEEERFWIEVGPALRELAPTGEAARTIEGRHQRLVGLLLALEELHASEAREPVRRLLAVFTQAPALLAFDDGRTAQLGQRLLGSLTE